MISEDTRKLVRLIKAREAKDIVGLSLPQTYTLVNKMPAGVVVRLGRRVRFNHDALVQWVAAGGTCYTPPHASPRERES